MLAELSERRIGYGELISTGLHVVRRHFVPLLGISLTVNALNLVFTQRMNASMQPDGIPTLAWGGWYLAAMLVAVLGYALMVSTAAAATEARIRGENASFGGALASVMPRVPMVVLTSIVLMVLLVVLAFLLVIPFIWGAVVWAFALPVVVLRRNSAFAALGYSRRIVQSNWWWTFGFFAIHGIASLVISTPLMAWQVMSPGELAPLVVSSIFYALYTPIWSVNIVVLFLNLDYLEHGNLSEVFR